MVDKGLEAKATTLKDYFEKDEGLAGVGGTRYLVELATEVPLLNDVRDYAKTIFDRHLRREIIRYNQMSPTLPLIFHWSRMPMLFWQRPKHAFSNWQKQAQTAKPVCNPKRFRQDCAGICGAG